MFGFLSFVLFVSVLLVGHVIGATAAINIRRTLQVFAVERELFSSDVHRFPASDTGVFRFGNGKLLSAHREKVSRGVNRLIEARCVFGMLRASVLHADFEPFEDKPSVGTAQDVSHGAFSPIRSQKRVVLLVRVVV